MLDRLKQQGQLLGIITNGLGQFQTRSIEALEIRDYFDVILISEIVLFLSLNDLREREALWD
jgi:putative hydrolase of the HAD superfamily